MKIYTRAEMMERRKMLRNLAFDAFMARMNAQTYEPTADDYAEAQRLGLVWNPAINDFDDPNVARTETHDAAVERQFFGD